MADSGIRIIKHMEIKKEDLFNPICMVGMPGIADVGKFAIDSLIGQLKAETWMDIIFDDYPAGAIVEDSLLSAPKAEILIWRDPKKIRDILLITADAQSLTPKGIYKISNFLTEIIHNCGINLIVSLGAYPVSNRFINPKNPKVFATSTNRELLEKFLINSKFEKIQKGVIVGANGLIPTLAKARFNIDGLVLLSETDNAAMVNEDITDLKASIILLDIVKKSFSLPIRKKFSIENIENITKTLQNKKNQIEQDLDTVNVSDNAENNRKSLYI